MPLYLSGLRTAAFVFAAVGSPVFAGAPLVDLAQLPLRTASRWIVDVNGSRVKLACVNWAGAEQQDGVVGGLQHARLDSIVRNIVEWGFNCVRLPWSVWLVQANPVIDSDRLLHPANSHLIGKRAMELFDAVVHSCSAAKLMVILDNHMSDGDWCCSVDDQNGLWYNDRYSESDWVQAHVDMAKRYSAQPYVVASELRNELRSTVVGGVRLSPTWGSGDEKTDWRLAATRAADALLTVRPTGLLIVVDGLSFSTDLTSVRLNPISLSVPNRLVYSAHQYQWTQERMGPAELSEFLNRSWHYLAQEDQAYTAPVWVSEFGMYHDGPASAMTCSVCNGFSYGAYALTIAGATLLAVTAFELGKPIQSLRLRRVGAIAFSFGLLSLYLAYDPGLCAVCPSHPGLPWCACCYACWWSHFTEYLGETDLDWAYWRLDGTDSRGTGRLFDAEEPYGICDTTWSAPAGGGVLLRTLQSLQAEYSERQAHGSHSGQVDFPAAQPFAMFVVGLVTLLLCYWQVFRRRTRQQDNYVPLS